MDHVVYLDTKSKELENLVIGNKSMIIRADEKKKVPYGRVKEGDVLYFINNAGTNMVEAKGVVSSVFYSDRLSREESFETIIRNQDKLQLPDNQFEQVAGKSFLVLIGIGYIDELEPFFIEKDNFNGIDDWIPIDKIDMIAVNRNMA